MSTTLSFVVLSLFATLHHVVPASSNSNVVELYIVVDQHVFQNYKKGFDDNVKIKNAIREDVNFTVYQVNSYFSSLADRNLDVEVRIKKLDIMMDEAVIEPGTFFSPTSSFDILLGFFRWLAGKKEAIGFDTAVYLTGFNSAGAQIAQYSGSAFHGGVCKSSSVGWAKFSGTQESALHLAQVIAQNLGQDKLDEALGCGSDYVMAFNPSSIDNTRWMFSNCTLAAITAKTFQLNLSGMNCLTETSSSEVTLDMSTYDEKDIMNPDNVCQRKFNDEKSRSCSADNMCKSVQCLQDNTCDRNVLATEGMTCGMGKRCARGKCM